MDKIGAIHVKIWLKGDGDMRRRYEREIEELLAHMEKFLPEKPAPQRRERIRPWFGHFEGVFSSWWHRLSAQQLMLFSFLLVVVAFFLRFSVPTVAYFIGLAGAFLFVIAFALSFLKRGPYREKRWRGEVIDLSPWGNRLSRWLSRWMKRGK